MNTKKNSNNNISNKKKSQINNNPTNSSKLKLPKLDQLLKSNSMNKYEDDQNFQIDNINNINSLETPNRSEFEKKGSSELHLQDEESSQNSKNQIKTGKTKDYIRDSFIRKNTPSLADMMINLNSKNNNSSSSSQKTIAKPFNKFGLINKSQLKLASYIEKNKDITLTGTKRFTDKSGEYYLKNVQLQKKQDKKGPLSKALSLTRPQNLDNCFNKLNGNINKIRRNATKIITILPENSLTPIPVKEQNSVRGMAQIFNKRQYQNAERIAVFIRRMEYSNGVKNNLKHAKKNNEYINKIIFIQEWWRTMYKILMLQKWIRGFLFRRNLMKLLEHQENILKFITTFYNIHGFHLYRTFFDNLKKICNQINSKRTEMLEDFSEKMEKIEKNKNLRRLKDIWYKWKNKIKDEKNKEKADNFKNNYYRKKGIKGLKLNYISKLINDTLGKEKIALSNEIYNNKNSQNLLKGIKKLYSASKNDKKEIFERMKLFYFIKILSDIKKNVDHSLLKQVLGKLKQLYEYQLKKQAFNKWKELLNLNLIMQKLKNNKQKELESNKNLISKYILIWRNKKDIKNILERLKTNKIKENILLNLINKLDQLKAKINSDDIKETFNMLKNIYINKSPKTFKKRISYRKRIKKPKKATKDKLNKESANYKKVLSLLLFRLYKNKNNKLIKEYFDRWKKNINIQNKKYFKKKIIGNNLNQSKESNFSDLNKYVNKDDKKNNTFDKNFFFKEFSSKLNHDFIFDKMNNRKQKLLEDLKNKKKTNKIETEIDSDDTSVNISRTSGMKLEEEKTENLEPIIYTSQSFAIDKSIINDIQEEIPKINIYKNINNKYPMKMKGDFRKLIETNKDLFKTRNPRIQITNATCELEQFSPLVNTDPNNNINKINLLNLDPNISINMNKNYKKKDLKNVVNNCDKDIYEQKMDYEKEKQRWISMSIPLDNDMANWEFLDSLKGIRSKGNINKFELVQKNKSQKNIHIDNYNIKNIPSKNKNNENSNLQNMQFKLNEMNYKQYYKSLLKSEVNNSPIKLVKYDNKNRKEKKDYKIRSFDINIRNKFKKDNTKELSEESHD